MGAKGGTADDTGLELGALQDDGVAPDGSLGKHSKGSQGWSDGEHAARWVPQPAPGLVQGVGSVGGVGVPHVALLRHSRGRGRAEAAVERSGDSSTAVILCD